MDSTTDEDEGDRPGPSRGPAHGLKYLVVTPAEMRKLGLVASSGQMVKLTPGQAGMVRLARPDSVSPPVYRLQPQPGPSAPVKPSYSEQYSPLKFLSEDTRRYQQHVRSETRKKRRMVSSFTQFWHCSLEEKGYIRCPLRMCNYISLGFMDMCVHYAYCTGDSQNKTNLCKLCNFRLATERDLQTHIRLSHAPGTEEETPPLPYKEVDRESPPLELRPLARKRSHCNVHKISWQIALNSQGYVKCLFKNCNCMALTIQDMIEHYSTCNGSDAQSKFYCPFCDGGVKNKTILRKHILMSHQSDNTEIVGCPKEDDETTDESDSKHSLGFHHSTFSLQTVENTRSSFSSIVIPGTSGAQLMSEAPSLCGRYDLQSNVKHSVSQITSIDSPAKRPIVCHTPYTKRSQSVGYSLPSSSKVLNVVPKEGSFIISLKNKVNNVGSEQSNDCFSGGGHVEPEARVKEEPVCRVFDDLDDTYEEAKKKYEDIATDPLSLQNIVTPVVEMEELGSSELDASFSLETNISSSTNKKTIKTYKKKKNDLCVVRNDKKASSAVLNDSSIASSVDLESEGNNTNAFQEPAFYRNERYDTANVLPQTVRFDIYPSDSEKIHSRVSDQSENSIKDGSSTEAINTIQDSENCLEDNVMQLTVKFDAEKNSIVIQELNEESVEVDGSTQAQFEEGDLSQIPVEYEAINIEEGNDFIEVTIQVQDGVDAESEDKIDSQKEESSMQAGERDESEEIQDKTAKSDSCVMNENVTGIEEENYIQPHELLNQDIVPETNQSRESVINFEGKSNDLCNSANQSSKIWHFFYRNEVDDEVTEQEISVKDPKPVSWSSENENSSHVVMQTQNDLQEPVDSIISGSNMESMLQSPQSNEVSHFGGDAVLSTAGDMLQSNENSCEYLVADTVPPVVCSPIVDVLRDDTMACASCSINEEGSPFPDSESRGSETALIEENDLRQDAGKGTAGHVVLIDLTIESESSISPREGPLQELNSSDSSAHVNNLAIRAKNCSDRFPNMESTEAETKQADFIESSKLEVEHRKVEELEENLECITEPVKEFKKTKMAASCEQNSDHVNLSKKFTEVSISPSKEEIFDVRKDDCEEAHTQADVSTSKEREINACNESETNAVQECRNVDTLSEGFEDLGVNISCATKGSPSDVNHTDGAFISDHAIAKDHSDEKSGSLHVSLGSETNVQVTNNNNESLTTDKGNGADTKTDSVCESGSESVLVAATQPCTDSHQSVVGMVSVHIKVEHEKTSTNNTKHMMVVPKEKQILHSQYKNCEEVNVAATGDLKSHMQKDMSEGQNLLGKEYCDSDCLDCLKEIIEHHVDSSNAHNADNGLLCSSNASIFDVKNNKSKKRELEVPFGDMKLSEGDILRDLSEYDLEKTINEGSNVEHSEPYSDTVGSNDAELVTPHIEKILADTIVKVVDICSDYIEEIEEKQNLAKSNTLKNNVDVDIVESDVLEHNVREKSENSEFTQNHLAANKGCPETCSDNCFVKHVHDTGCIAKSASCKTKDAKIDYSSESSQLPHGKSVGCAGEKTGDSSMSCDSTDVTKMNSLDCGEVQNTKISNITNDSNSKIHEEMEVEHCTESTANTKEIFTEDSSNQQKNPITKKNLLPENNTEYDGKGADVSDVFAGSNLEKCNSNAGVTNVFSSESDVKESGKNTEISMTIYSERKMQNIDESVVIVVKHPSGNGNKHCSQNSVTEELLRDCVGEHNEKTVVAGDNLFSVNDEDPSKKCIASLEFSDTFNMNQGEKNAIVARLFPVDGTRKNSEENVSATKMFSGGAKKKIEKSDNIVNEHPDICDSEQCQKDALVSELPEEQCGESVSGTMEFSVGDKNKIEKNYNTIIELRDIGDAEHCQKDALVSELPDVGEEQCGESVSGTKEFSSGDTKKIVKDDNTIIELPDRGDAEQCQKDALVSELPEVGEKQCEENVSGTKEFSAVDKKKIEKNDTIIELLDRGDAEQCQKDALVSELPEVGEKQFEESVSGTKEFSAVDKKKIEKDDNTIIELPDRGDAEQCQKDALVSELPEVGEKQCDESVSGTKEFSAVDKKKIEKGDNIVNERPDIGDSEQCQKDALVSELPKVGEEQCGECVSGTKEFSAGDKKKIEKSFNTIIELPDIGEAEHCQKDALVSELPEVGEEQCGESVSGTKEFSSGDTKKIEKDDNTIIELPDRGDAEQCQKDALVSELPEVGEKQCEDNVSGTKEFSAVDKKKIEKDDTIIELLDRVDAEQCQKDALVSELPEVGEKQCEGSVSGTKEFSAVDKKKIEKDDNTIIELPDRGDAEQCQKDALVSELPEVGEKQCEDNVSGTKEFSAVDKKKIEKDDTIIELLDRVDAEQCQKDALVSELPEVVEKQCEGSVSGTKEFSAVDKKKIEKDDNTIIELPERVDAEQCQKDALVSELPEVGEKQCEESVSGTKEFSAGDKNKIEKYDNTIIDLPDRGDAEQCQKDALVSELPEVGEKQCEESVSGTKEFSGDDVDSCEKIDVDAKEYSHENKCKMSATNTKQFSAEGNTKQFEEGEVIKNKYCNLAHINQCEKIAATTEISNECDREQCLKIQQCKDSNAAIREFSDGDDVEQCEKMQQCEVSDARVLKNSSDGDDKELCEKIQHCEVKDAAIKEFTDVDDKVHCEKIVAAELSTGIDIEPCDKIQQCEKSNAPIKEFCDGDNKDKSEMFVVATNKFSVGGEGENIKECDTLTNVLSSGSDRKQYGNSSVLKELSMGSNGECCEKSVAATVEFSDNDEAYYCEKTTATKEFSDEGYKHHCDKTTAFVSQYLSVNGIEQFREKAVVEMVCSGGSKRDLCKKSANGDRDHCKSTANDSSIKKSWDEVDVQQCENIVDATVFEFSAQSDLKQCENKTVVTKELSAGLEEELGELSVTVATKELSNEGCGDRKHCENIADAVNELSGGCDKPYSEMNVAATVESSDGRKGEQWDKSTAADTKDWSHESDKQQSDSAAGGKIYSEASEVVPCEKSSTATQDLSGEGGREQGDVSPAVNEFPNLCDQVQCEKSDACFKEFSRGFDKDQLLRSDTVMELSAGGVKCEERSDTIEKLMHECDRTCENRAAATKKFLEGDVKAQCAKRDAVISVFSNEVFIEQSENNTGATMVVDKGYEGQDETSAAITKDLSNDSDREKIEIRGNDVSICKGSKQIADELCSKCNVVHCNTSTIISKDSKSDYSEKRDCICEKLSFGNTAKFCEKVVETVKDSSIVVEQYTKSNSLSKEFCTEKDKEFCENTAVVTEELSAGSGQQFENNSPTTTDLSNKQEVNAEHLVISDAVEHTHVCEVVTKVKDDDVRVEVKRDVCNLSVAEKALCSEIENGEIQQHLSDLRKEIVNECGISNHSSDSEPSIQLDMHVKEKEQQPCVVTKCSNSATGFSLKCDNGKSSGSKDVPIQSQNISHKDILSKDIDTESFSDNESVHSFLEESNNTFDVCEKLELSEGADTRVRPTSCLRETSLEVGEQVREGSDNICVIAKNTVSCVPEMSAQPSTDVFPADKDNVTEKLVCENIRPSAIKTYTKPLRTYKSKISHHKTDEKKTFSMSFKTYRSKVSSLETDERKTFNKPLKTYKRKISVLKTDEKTLTAPSLVKCRKSNCLEKSVSDSEGNLTVFESGGCERGSSQLDILSDSYVHPLFSSTESSNDNSILQNDSVLSSHVLQDENLHLLTKVATEVENNNFGLNFMNRCSSDQNNINCDMSSSGKSDNIYGYKQIDMSKQLSNDSLIAQQGESSSENSTIIKTYQDKKSRSYRKRKHLPSDMLSHEALDQLENKNDKRLENKSSRASVSEEVVTAANLSESILTSHIVDSSIVMSHGSTENVIVEQSNAGQSAESREVFPARTETLLTHGGIQSTSTATNVVVEQGEITPQPIKRKRGRPRKVPQNALPEPQSVKADVKVVSDDSQDTTESIKEESFSDDDWQPTGKRRRLAATRFSSDCDRGSRQQTRKRRRFMGSRTLGISGDDDCVRSPTRKRRRLVVAQSFSDDDDNDHQPTGKRLGLVAARTISGDDDNSSHSLDEDFKDTSARGRSSARRGRGRRGRLWRGRGRGRGKWHSANRLITICDGDDEDGKPTPPKFAVMSQYRFLSAKEADLEVTCAKCGEKMKKANFMHHNLQVHSCLAWLEGEEPLDMTNTKLLSSLVMKAWQLKKQLKCETCGVLKRSVAGFLSHLTMCQKSNEEREALKQPCEVCGRLMLPVSLKVHANVHRKPEVPVEEPNQPLPTKRAAATKAISKLQHFIEEEEKASDEAALETRRRKRSESPTDDGSLYTPTNHKLEKNHLTTWKRYITKDGEAKCRNIGCQFKSSELEELKSHFETCSHSIMKGFRCQLCNHMCALEPDMIKHVDEVHVRACDDEETCFTDEDDSSDDDMFVEKKKKKTTTAGAPSQKDVASTYRMKLYTRMKYLSKGKYGPALGNTPYIPALQWTLDFHRKHYSQTLFTEYRVQPDDWIPLDEEQSLEYAPMLKQSLRFSSVEMRKKIRDVKNDADLQFTSMKLFEGCILQGEEESTHCAGVPTLFAGGPVWALAWCPLPTQLLLERYAGRSSGDVHQFLAVSCHRDPDAFHKYTESYSGKGLLQIWDMGHLYNRSLAQAPRFALGIAHEYGTVWHLEWCPSGCYDPAAPRGQLGLLAAACSDGTGRVFCVPAPSQLPGGAVCRTPPALTLVLVDGPSDAFQCTRLSWQRCGGHRIIAGGFTNGMVALWDISTTSPLLKSSGDKTVVLKPYKTFQPHFGPVTGVSLCPFVEGRYLMTSSPVDSTVKVWDLESTILPLLHCRRGYITDGLWMSHWVAVFASYDDVFSMKHSNGTLYPVRNFGYTPRPLTVHNSACWNASGCEWLNALAHGTQAGELCVNFPHQLLVAVDTEKGTRNKRKMLSYVEVIDESELQDKIANSIPQTLDLEKDKAEISEEGFASKEKIVKETVKDDFDGDSSCSEEDSIKVEEKSSESLSQERVENCEGSKSVISKETERPQPSPGKDQLRETSGPLARNVEEEMQSMENVLQEVTSDKDEGCKSQAFDVQSNDKTVLGGRTSRGVRNEEHLLNETLTLTDTNDSELANDVPKEGQLLPSACEEPTGKLNPPEGDVQGEEVAVEGETKAKPGRKKHRPKIAVERVVRRKRLCEPATSVAASTVASCGEEGASTDSPAGSVLTEDGLAEDARWRRERAEEMPCVGTPLLDSVGECSSSSFLSSVKGEDPHDAKKSHSGCSTPVTDNIEVIYMTDITRAHEIGLKVNKKTKAKKLFFRKPTNNFVLPESDSSEKFMKRPNTYAKAASTYKVIICNLPRDNWSDVPEEVSRWTRQSGQMRMVPVDMYPITSINRVSWNPNCGSFLHVAAGYHSGLVQVPRLASMHTPEVAQFLAAAAVHPPS